MLLITAGVRPASIWHRGAEIMIYVHDEWYIQRCRYLLAEMKATHPDRGTNRWGRQLTGQTFISRHRTLLRFKKDQAVWYKEFRLNPPKVSISACERRFRQTGCMAKAANAK
jgi:hypothetical protein